MPPVPRIEISASADEPAKKYAWLSTVVVVAAFSTLLLIYFAVRFGLNEPPSASGDEPSYDSLGWQIHLGNGFREDFQDPAFRMPYDRAALHDPVLMSLASTLPGTVTYRPPLFPALIAATDYLFGRQFWAVRTLNVLLIAISGALVFRFLLLSSGWPAAVCGLVLFFLIDVRVRLYSRAILTEALAVFLMTLVSLALIRLVQTRRIWHAAELGFVFGLAMLNRSAFVLWLPGLALAVVFLATYLRSSGKDADLNSSRTPEFFRACGLASIILLTAVVVYLPWAVRNVQTLGRMMPLGTQGVAELSAAFSDEAYQRQGVWFNLQELDFFQQVDQPSMTRIEQEIARADFSRSQAIQWMHSNPSKVLMLGAFKVFHEYRPRSVAEWTIGVCVLAGLVVACREPFICVFFLLHAVNAVMIAATWSVEGRFLVPMLFSIHVTAAWGLWAMVSRLWLLRPAGK